MSVNHVVGRRVGVADVGSILLSLVALGNPALAQLFNITAQDRSVRASVSCIAAGGDSETLAAPDLNSWTATAQVFCAHAVPPGGHNSASCTQVSTIGASSLSGSISDNRFQDFGGSVTTGGICSLTFSTTATLQYDFTLTSSGSQGPAWAASLTDTFSGAGSAPEGMRRTDLIHPGTYTLLIRYGGAYPSGTLTYSLSFTAVTAAKVVAGPLSRPGDSHTYYQLAASNWFTAEATARTLGGHLVTITDAPEQAWLESTFGGVGPGEKWIGLTSKSVPNSIFYKWVSGHQTTFTNWAPGRPGQGGGAFAYLQADGRWSQSVHTAAKGGIVEVPAEGLPEIVAGPISNPDDTRRYYQLAPSSWRDAEERAVQLGGHLVSINTAGEQSWLADRFASIGPANKWVGLNARTAPGSAAFRWASAQAITYTHWALSAPVEGLGDFSHMRPDGMWEQSAGDSDMNTGGIVETGDLVHIGPFPRLCGHTYSQLVPSSWHVAEAEAVALGGHLVTVNNAGENDWLFTTFGLHTTARKWIGLRRSSGSVFAWTSGDPSAYRAWSFGYPLMSFDYAIQWFNGSWYSSGPEPDQTYDLYVGIIETSPCRCDWNLDGDRTSADFFAFLNEFFSAGADFNCSGATNSMDFFDFLTCFFAAGCP